MKISLVVLFLMVYCDFLRTEACLPSGNLYVIPPHNHTETGNQQAQPEEVTEGNSEAVTSPFTNRQVAVSALSPDETRSSESTLVYTSRPLASNSTELAAFSSTVGSNATEAVVAQPLKAAKSPTVASNATVSEPTPVASAVTQESQGTQSAVLTQSSLVTKESVLIMTAQFTPSSVPIAGSSSPTQASTLNVTAEAAQVNQNATQQPQASTKASANNTPTLTNSTATP